MKSGYKTTEFWTAVATGLINLLIQGNIVGEGFAASEEAQLIYRGASVIATSIVAVVYIKSRGDAKRTAIEAVISE